jgi:hypothetical protein
MMQILQLQLSYNTCHVSAPVQPASLYTGNAGAVKDEIDVVAPALPAQTASLYTGNDDMADER